MWALLLCLVALLCSSSSQKPVLINDIVERQMEDHNDMLTKYDFGLTPISPISVGGLELSNGVQVGMNSLYRTDDCFARRVGRYSTQYIYKIGFRLLALAFGKMTFRGESMSGLFLVNNNSMDFVYTIHNGTSICKVVLDRYKFIKFENIEVRTSNPKYDNIDEFYQEDLLSLVNDFADKQRKAMEDHLAPLCGHPQPIIL